MKTILILLNVLTMAAINQPKAPFVLPPLPYENTALQPYMSAETLDYHHGKHLQAYVNNLNNLVKGTEFENMALEDIIRKATGGIYNNAGQLWNHTLFFESFSANPKTAPTGKLAEAIDRDFGSLEKFREEFSKSAASLFGSGWTWLVADHNGKLRILNLPNGDNPIRDGLNPLMGIDVWEHSYYIDYRNARADYIKAFWNIFDWKTAETRY